MPNYNAFWGGRNPQLRKNTLSRALRDQEPAQWADAHAGLGATRRRTFTGAGRHPETLQAARADLNNEGTDYLLLPESPASSPPLLAIVQTMLAASPTPLTGRELVARRPGAVPCPNRLRLTLTRGDERGLFTVSGTSTETDAFRYGVAGKTKAEESAGGDQPAAADAS